MYMTIFIILVVILGVAAAAYWYFFMRGSAENTNTQMDINEPSMHAENPALPQDPMESMEQGASPEMPEMEPAMPPANLPTADGSEMLAPLEDDQKEVQ